jgi:hypothetical protein
MRLYTTAAPTKKARAKGRMRGATKAKVMVMVKTNRLSA